MKGAIIIAFITLIFLGYEIGEIKNRLDHLEKSQREKK